MFIKKTRLWVESAFFHSCLMSWWYCFFFQYPCEWEMSSHLDWKFTPEGDKWCHPVIKTQNKHSLELLSCSFAQSVRIEWNPGQLSSEITFCLMTEEKTLDVPLSYVSKAKILSQKESKTYWNLLCLWGQFIFTFTLWIQSVFFLQSLFPPSGS